MAIDPEKLLNREFGSVRETYTEKDCILYALGVGMGLDPLDEECLRFVYEDNLKTLPSQSVIMAHPGFWAKDEDTDIDWVKVLHAGQEVIFHSPIPSSCTVEATTRISRRLGPQRTKQALIAIEKEQWDQACDAMLDYYDRCYEHELARSSQRETIDISGLTPDEASKELLNKGLIC